MPRSLWLLIIGMTINVTGASFLWPLNTIYIHEHLGRSLTFAGVILMLNSAAGIVGNLFGGVLFDKVGGFKSILIGLSMATGAAFLLVFFHQTFAYTLLLIVIGFGSGMIFPSMYAMAGMVWPRGGRKPFNALYVSQNIGVALGASLGGIIASVSFTYIFISNGLMYLIFLGLVLLTYKRLEKHHQKADTASPTSIFEQNHHIKSKHKFISLLILCFGFFLCWIAYVQWQTTIATYTQNVGISLAQYSLLWSINGALIVVSQPIVSLVTRLVTSLKVQIIFGVFIFMSSFVVVSFVHHFQGFLISMIILTLGEIFVWPAVPSLAHDLAPEGRAGFYQGFVNSTATAGRMVGPIFGGIIVDRFGIHKLFFILLFIYLGAILTTLIYDALLKEKKIQLYFKN